MNKSQEIKNISAAMIAVQKEIKGMTPDAKNPFFKSNYITLDGILEYIRPILSKNEIWLVQEAKGIDSNVSVRTSLIHSSGEFLETESIEMVPSKNDPQVLGSLITYLKRYQLAALLGISSEVDDDGNKATHGSDKPKESKPTGALNEAQINRLFAIAKTAGFKAEDVKKHMLSKYKITSTDKLTKAQYDEMCTGYESLKNKAV